MSLPRRMKLTHNSVETGTEVVPLFLEEKVRIGLHKLQVILEDTVSLIDSVLVRVSTECAGLIRFLNQHFRALGSVFFSKCGRVLWKCFPDRAGRISACIEHASLTDLLRRQTLDHVRPEICGLLAGNAAYGIDSVGSSLHCLLYLCAEVFLQPKHRLQSGFPANRRILMH